MCPAEELLEKCRAAGMRITPQRRAIFDVLEGNITHPTAEEVFRAVRRRFRGVSLATVYNTLETLHGLGELGRHRIDDGADRFDPEVRPHHHFRCTRCGQVIDAFGELRLPALAELASCRVERAELVLSGECPACLKSLPSPKSKRKPQQSQGEHP